MCFALLRNPQFIPGSTKQAFFGRITIAERRLDQGENRKRRELGGEEETLTLPAQVSYGV